MRVRQGQTELTVSTHLISIDGVIMFDRVDFGHGEGNRKPHYGYRKGLHSAVLEHIHIRRDGSLVPERWLSLTRCI